MTISSELFSILAIGVRKQDVYNFLYRYIRKAGHAPWRHCFLTDQISFS